MKQVWWKYWTPFTGWFWSPCLLNGYAAEGMTQDPYTAGVFS